MGKRLEQWILRYADWVIRYRWWVIILTLLVVMGAASGGRYLGFSNNYRVFFSQENPELKAFDRFQGTYTKNDNIIFVLQPADGQVFSHRVAEAIEKLTAEAWKVPYAIRVDSISNFQHSWAQGDELTVEDLVRDGESLSEAELARRQAIALAEPLLHNNLLSADANTTGINVTVQYPEIDNMKEVPEAVLFARQLRDQLRAEYPDLKVALTGLSMLNNAFAESGQTDAQTLVPLMYLVLIIMLTIGLRSISGTIATIVIIGVSTATAMGLAGYFGIKLTPVSVTAPTVIMTLAIADSVHVLVSMFSSMREGHDKISALKESLRINFTPVSVTSLTTIIGFLSLNFSDAPPFWHLGNITAMGIAAAWVFSLMLLPALVSVLPMRRQQKTNHVGLLERLLMSLAEFVISQRRKLLVVMSVTFVGLIALLPSLQLNDQFVRYFDHRVEFRNDTDFTVKNLNGIYVVEYSVPAKDSGGISDPEYLTHLAEFTDWLRTQGEVMHVYSYSDIIKRLNKNMHGDKTDWYRIPEKRDLAAQYLLLYELSLPFGLDLNDRVNIEKSATRVSVSIKEISTGEIRDFVDRSRDWLDNHAPGYMKTTPTGASVMFSHISQRNIESMLQGNAVAIVLIAVIMMVALRSIGMGALSLIPNALPILATFGLWALLVGEVGMAAATVTATSLGIVVDDSVHFLSKYLRARREKGLDQADAVRYAFRTVGTAIVLTTIVLVVGFSVLAGSTFLINSQLGLLTALAVILALLADFLLLPTLLLIGYQQKQEVSYELQQNTQAA